MKLPQSKKQGANFTSPTPLNLFDPVENSNKGPILKNIKATVLYGRNGTGKSTIAKAFRKLKGETLSTIAQASAFNKDGNIITLRMSTRPLKNGVKILRLIQQ